MIELLLAFKFGMMAYVYTEILVLGGMILNPWYKFLERHIGHIPWLFKPLVDCGLCVGGQIALWGYIFSCEYYSIINHFFVITASIWWVIIIKATTKKLQQWN